MEMTNKKMKSRILILLNPELRDIVEKLPYGASTLSAKCRSIICSWLSEHNLLNGLKIGENGQISIPEHKVKLKKKEIECFKKLK